jgi:hypothetical protein
MTLDLTRSVARPAGLAPAERLDAWPLLAGITCPRDLADMTHHQLDTLAGEIRRFLVNKVCASGGHLGVNLGVVELTIALHRVFDSPRDVLLFDTGHQSLSFNPVRWLWLGGARGGSGVGS